LNQRAEAVCQITGKKNEPPNADIGRLFQKALVPRLPLGGGEEHAEQQMNDVTNEMPEAIRHQARRILHDIENAGSMIAAVKNGAKANGFVLGVMCSRGLSDEQCDLLAEHFDKVTEMTLRRLALGT